MMGRYPTPVEHVPRLSLPGCDLWIKRDDLTDAVYGGNKVRKLEYLLPRAAKRDARRIVTIGAAGSHHVLATCVHGARAGLRVAAVLTRQPRTAHAVEVLRTALAQGLEAHAAGSFATVPLVLARVLRAGDFFIPPGGTTVAGSRGYFDAALELCRQVQAGMLPMPELIFVPLGSGGTAAGLLAGLRVAAPAPVTVVGVRVVEPWMTGRRRVEWLARAVERKGTPEARGEHSAALRVEDRFLGGGYGHPTRAGAAASERASELGIVLEPTYTAKTFAAALEAVASRSARRVLYWNTLSSAPMAPLRQVLGAPARLPDPLGRLFVSPGGDFEPEGHG